jgi:hypothetical protein
MKRLAIALFSACCGAVLAQSPDSTPDSTPSDGGQPGQESKLPGSAGLPAVDPSGEMVTWDGQTWSITNNRLFQGQFERYLNTPEESSLTVVAYEDILGKIHDLLTAAPVTPQGLDQAFHLLSLAAAVGMDGKFSDVLAGQIYATWMAKNETQRIQNATQVLQAERSRLEWNMKVTAESNMEQTSQTGKLSAAVNEAKRATLQETTIQPLAKRLAEVETLLQKKDLDKEYDLAQARTDFQTLIVQFFLQRRFEHVTVAISFYRALFNEGAGQVKLGDEAMSFFSKTSGSPPTLASLDSMAREIAQNVRQGDSALKVMLDNRQVQTASNRLAELYAVGQNLPEINLYPLANKQQILAFVQKSNRLLAALDVKDYAQAETLLDDLQKSAADFDPTKPNAAIQTSKLSAEMHLAKARNAAVEGDKATLERELQAAAEIWPTNPQLKELSAKIFEQADVGAQALADLDQLLGQKNYRMIYDQRMRFIAATATRPDKQEALKKVLDDMTQIEIAMQQAAEIDKRGDSAGAWESIESVARNSPDDIKLNQYLANLTIKAAAFVNVLKSAEEYEKADRPACALTAYLAAQKLYPYSQFAKDGIQRTVKEIHPDAQ